MRLTHDTGRHIKKYTLDPSDQLRFPALARERPRLPLEGKLSPQVTDEVCRIRFNKALLPAKRNCCNTSSVSPSGCHLPLKGKAFV